MIGKDFVSYLKEQNRNFQITLSNRGVTNSNLFLDLPLVKIDRNIESSCEILKNYSFDLIVDFSCYNPQQFKNTLKYLKYNKYIYISTMSVHEQNIIQNPDLNNDYHNYCVQKFLIEKFITETQIKNCLIIRPCAIYGDDDYTNRFYKKYDEYYWKCDNSKVGIGTMFVRGFSKFLFTHINEYPEIGSIDVCNVWWN